MYQVSNHKQTTLPLALIDRGANGGVAGSDTWLIDKSLRSVHIQGINDHMIKDVPIGTVGAVVNTQRGEVIAIDKICIMTTRLACNQAIESSYWRMDNDSDVGLLMGYVLYRLPVELEFMDLDTFPC
jgi:hypothetical protein